MMEWRITLAAIFAAVAIVGAMETIYQIYQVTVIDAAARGLKQRFAFVSDRTKKIPTECN